MKKTKIYRVGAAFMAALMVFTCMPQTSLYAWAEEQEITEAGNADAELSITSIEEDEASPSSEDTDTIQGDGVMPLDGGGGDTPTTPPTPVVVKPTGITISGGDFTLTRSTNIFKDLTATVSPTDATDKTVTWQITNPADKEVASLNKTGDNSCRVVAKGNGTATITATAGGDPSVTTTCTVTVNTAVSGVELDKTEHTELLGTLGAGETAPTVQLTATVKPIDASNQNVTWSSSTIDVATVSASGLVTVKAVGETDITVKTEDGNYTAKCHLTVSKKPVSVTAIEVDGAVLKDGKYTAEISVGDDLHLRAHVAPADATNKALHYESSDLKAATVDGGGWIHGVGQELGTLDKDGKVIESATCTITITSDEKKADGVTPLVTQEVSVTVKPIPVTALELRYRNNNPLHSMTLTEGDESDPIKAEVTPKNATIKSVTWKVTREADETGDVSVNDIGNGEATITAVKEGECTVTAVSDCKKDSAGNAVEITASFKVSVKKFVKHVTGITLDQHRVTVREAETVQLTATVAPEDADNKTVNWESSDENVATVDENGLVTAVGFDGDVCEIRAISDDQGFRDTCIVTISEGAVPVNSVTLNKDRLVLMEGDEFTLIATVLPDNATNQKVRWHNSNNTIIHMDTDGYGTSRKVTALHDGECVITAYAGKQMVQCTVKVTKTDISVSPESLRYAKSDKADRERILEDLTVNYYPMVDGEVQEVAVKDDCTYTLYATDQETGEKIQLADDEWQAALVEVGDKELKVSYTDANGKIYEKTVRITITEKPPVKLSWIGAIPKEWDVPNGKAYASLPLASSVKIGTVDEDGVTAERYVNISWDRSKTASGSYSPSIVDVEQDFTMAGTIILPDDVVADGKSLTVTQEVNVREKMVGGMVARVTPSVKNGSSVARNTQLVLTSETEGANIRYTTNGTQPNRDSSLYTGPIVLNENTPVIKVIAMKQGWQNSIVDTFYYKIDTSLAPLDPDNPDQPYDPNDPEGPEPPVPDDVTPEDKEHIGGKTEGLWAVVQGGESTDEKDGVARFTYTGKAMKPAVHVYDGTKLLTEKKDYTVSYQNNTKVGGPKTTAKYPTVTITGKGNYEGKTVVPFIIMPIDLSDEAVMMDDYVAVPYTGKALKPTPKLTWNGKGMSNKRDYTFTDTTYTQPGTYKLTVTGMGNYTGTRTMSFEIYDKGVAISKMTFSKVESQKYTGKRITPEITVKNKTVTLTPGANYEVKYENNLNVGTASLVVVGKGNYKGTKRINFKILPSAKISQAGVNLVFDPVNPVYTGEAIVPKECTLTYAGTLEKDRDYTINYQNNVNAGKATILITGMGGFTGTVKKTYKISPLPIGGLQVTMGNSFPYQKGGCKPKPEVVFGNRILAEGTDYTLSYKNNNRVGNNASVTIKGKGNFTGSVVKYFAVTEQDIGNLQVSAADVTYKEKKNMYKTKVRVIDTNGKALEGDGIDYNNGVTYTYASGAKRGQQVLASDIVPVGTKIQVEVRVTNPKNYYGTAYGTYRIVQADIAKANVKVAVQEYTGRRVKPGKNQIEITMNGTTVPSGSYEITGYSNNVNQGTAKLTIRGLGNYGGTKTVTFKIKKRGILGLRF